MISRSAAIRLKFTGHDSHKSDPVPVSLIHIGLDLKDEGGEVLVEGVDHLISRLSGQGGGGQPEELL